MSATLSLPTFESRLVQNARARMPARIRIPFAEDADRSTPGEAFASGEWVFFSRVQDRVPVLRFECGQLSLYAASTACTSRAPDFSDDLRGLAAALSVKQDWHDYWSSLRFLLVSADEWALPEELGGGLLTQDSDESAVPPELREAVDRTTQLAYAESFFVGVPRRSVDPEIENEWCVTIPVTFYGTVNNGLVAYGELVEAFVGAVGPADRRRISIDLVIEEKQDAG